MKQSRIEELKQKGWDDVELKRAQRILERAHEHDQFFAKIVFYSALFVIIVANLAVAFVLIPFLLVINTTFLYAIVAILGLTIGGLYLFLITDIGHIERHHHVLATIFVPIIALVNMIGVSLITNRIIRDSTLTLSIKSPVLLAITFSLAFLLPSIIHEIVRER